MFELGVVEYLNAVPLVARLGDGVRVEAAVPSALGPRLDAGEFDAALLPVAEGLCGVGDGFLGRHGITSDGPVASVLLFLRCPLGDVRHVVLDAASRTSARLVRWILAREGRTDLRFETARAAGMDPARLEADAVLVIGDPALEYRERWAGEILDLGTAWTGITGLPFVYARWTARRGLEARQRERLAGRLDEAAVRGIADREALARAWARERGGDPVAAAHYVLRHVGYEIGAREEAGLARYAGILRADEAKMPGEVRHA